MLKKGEPMVDELDSEAQGIDIMLIAKLRAIEL